MFGRVGQIWSCLLVGGSNPIISGIIFITIVTKCAALSGPCPDLSQIPFSKKDCGGWDTYLMIQHSGFWFFLL
jgi:hypothetical protein